MTETDDAQLAADFAAGRPGALASAYQRWATTIHGRALAATGEAEMADAVTRDTFVNAWSERAAFRPEDESLATWLRAALQLRLRLNATSTDLKSLDDELSLLDDEDRAALELAVLHKLDHEQVANRVGRTPQDVADSMYPALIRLRDRLEADRAAL